MLALSALSNDGSTKLNSLIGGTPSSSTKVSTTISLFVLLFCMFRLYLKDCGYNHCLHLILVLDLVLLSIH